VSCRCDLTAGPRLDSEAAGDEIELLTDGPLRVQSLQLHRLASSWVRP
jgi:hypothetical protein